MLIKNDPELIKGLKIAWRDCCDCIHGKENRSRPECDECFDDPGRPDWELKATP